MQGSGFGQGAGISKELHNAAGLPWGNREGVVHGYGSTRDIVALYATLGGIPLSVVMHHKRIRSGATDKVGVVGGSCKIEAYDNKLVFTIV
ncbi:hypothetical protein [Agarilytica rhodophyticola]|uniref:hypothetical protein n=1 Tax=Agarilytica rhodophyticola TaxID=1737490 RepID=UPI000B3463F8|nr:hypothetical protein [Agarilytica rhodophyticola]